MTRSTLTNALVIGSLAAAHVAAADPKHVLVLKPEGNADAATKAKVDAQVVKLAKSLEGNVEAGEITFSDAAAAVGCSGNESQCRDDVLSTMGVDEVVSINATSLPSGDLRVVVHRVPKGGAVKDAQTTIPGGQALDAKLASDIGPLFGVKAKPAGGATGGAVAGGAATGGATAGGAPAGGTKPAGTTAGGTTAGGTTAGGATAGTSSSGAWGGPTPAGTTTSSSSGAWSGSNSATPASGSTSSSAGASSAAHTATPTRTAQAEPTNVTAAPNGQVTTPNEGRSSSRAVTGLAVGGGLVVLSVIMWAEASSTQGDINSAPTRSPADFQRLQDLESKGDTYAGLGNLFFIGGVVVGGISGYYFWKSHRGGSSTQARLAPTMFDHGAGLAFTVGGAP